VCTYVVDSFEREEFGVRDLVGRTPCLFEEIGIASPDEDEAGEPPRLKILCNGAFS
jgi:hypothetical protein